MLIANPLNEHAWAYPALISVHIFGMVCGAGTAAVVNTRLLGVGLLRNSPSQLWRALAPWTLAGLVLAIFSGLLLFSIDPDAYYVNPAFRLKMVFLVAALIFYYTLVRKAAASGKGRAIACVSLALWTLVPFGGIFIGFTG